MLNTANGRLRVAALAEGTSFLVLLGVAMPLKYLAGMPEAVRIVGMAHGVLWMILVLLIADAWNRLGWSAGRVLVALIGSVTPFGPFILEARLRREAAPLVQATSEP